MSESSSLTPGKSLESDLRLIREAKGLTREDVFNRVHIRPEVLAQVEEFGFAATPTLSSDIHRRSFVKHYADAIGLDPATALKALNQSLDGAYDGSLAREYLEVQSPDESRWAKKEKKERAQRLAKPPDAAVDEETSTDNAREASTASADHDDEVTHVKVVSSEMLIDDLQDMPLSDETEEVAETEKPPEIAWPIGTVASDADGDASEAEVDDVPEVPESTGELSVADIEEKPSEASSDPGEAMGKADKVEEVQAAETAEVSMENEPVKDAETVEAVEEIEVVDAVEAPVESEPVKDVETVEEVEAVEEIEVVDAVEAPVEVEPVKDVETVDEVEAVEEIEVVDAVEAPVESEPVKDVETVEEVEAVEETKAVDAVEAPVESGPVKDAETVDEVEAVEEIEAVDAVEAPVEVEPVKDVETVDEVEAVEEAKEVEAAEEIEPAEDVEEAVAIEEIPEEVTLNRDRNEVASAAEIEADGEIETEGEDEPELEAASEDEKAAEPFLEDDASDHAGPEPETGAGVTDPSRSTKLASLASPYAPPVSGLETPPPVESPPEEPKTVEKPVPAEAVVPPPKPKSSSKRHKSKRRAPAPPPSQEPARIHGGGHSAERRESWSRARSSHLITWLGLLGVLVVVVLFLVRSFTHWLSVDQERVVHRRSSVSVEALPERFSGVVRLDDNTEQFVTLLIDVSDTLKPNEFEFKMWTHSAGSLYAMTGEGSLDDSGEQVTFPDPYGRGGVFVTEEGEVRMRSVRRVEFPRWEFTGQIK